MINFSLMVLILFVSGYGEIAGAGFNVGNGGDVAVCRKSQENSLEGYYSLDYLLTKAPSDDDLVKIESLNESMLRIGALLKRNAPSLSESFNSFADSLFNEKDFTKKRTWEPAGLSIIDVKDEDLGSTTVLPENCRHNNQVRIYQAIIRMYSDVAGIPADRTIYKFHKDTIDQLSQQALQISFLMIHEWLWDLSKNVDRNRRVTRFLHSREAAQMDRPAFELILRSFGLRIPGETPPAFENTFCQPNPSSLNEVFRRFGDQAGWRVLSNSFKVLSRSKECRETKGCFDLWDYRDWTTDLIEPMNGLILRRDNFARYSLEFSSSAGAGLRKHLICDVDSKTGHIRCGSVTDRQGYVWSYLGNLEGYNQVGGPIIFEGFLTGECVKLSARGYINEVVGNGSYGNLTIDEFVLFSEFLAK